MPGPGKLWPARSDPVATFSAIIEIISNMTAAPTMAVMLFGLSLVGIMQTTSPLMIFRPLAACSSSTASSIENPVTPGSMLSSRATDGQGNQIEGDVDWPPGQNLLPGRSHRRRRAGGNPPSSRRCSRSHRTAAASPASADGREARSASTRSDRSAGPRYRSPQCAADFSAPRKGSTVVKTSVCASRCRKQIFSPPASCPAPALDDAAGDRMVAADGHRPRAAGVDILVEGGDPLDAVLGVVGPRKGHIAGIDNPRRLRGRAGSPGRGAARPIRSAPRGGQDAGRARWCRCRWNAAPLQGRYRHCPDCPAARGTGSERPTSTNCPSCSGRACCSSVPLLVATPRRASLAHWRPGCEQGYALERVSGCRQHPYTCADGHQSNVPTDTASARPASEHGKT